MMGDIGPNEHEVEFLPLDEPETEVGAGARGRPGEGPGEGAGMSEPIAGTYEGFRLFQVDGHRLESIAAHFTYEPGVNHAVCLAGEEHDPPAKGCSCGFWLYHHQHRAREQFKAAAGAAPAPKRPPASATSETRRTRFPTWYSAR